jgi:tRNA threonylcarbamoyladenosine biosynthesis protein TsaB
VIILSIRTDKPESEIGLYDDEHKLGHETWEAHRRLAETLHRKIEELLNAHEKTWRDVNGIVVYKGPGSFTGLRIGISVANALAYANEAAITGSTGEKWLQDGLSSLINGQNEKTVMPAYGSEAHITSPKK